MQHDVAQWMNESYGTDLAELELDEAKSLRLMRAPDRLPNADPGVFDASSGSTEPFNNWFYFVRNVRDYVVAAGSMKN